MVKFTPFLGTFDYMQIKFECVCPTPPWCLDEKLLIKLLYMWKKLYNINSYGADTLKFNLHIIGRAKKGCEFNQKRCEFKILL